MKKNGLNRIATMYGKIIHIWEDANPYPTGNPQLMMSLTEEVGRCANPTYVKAVDDLVKSKMSDRAEKRKKMLSYSSTIEKGADYWKQGNAIQFTTKTVPFNLEQQCPPLKPPTPHKPPVQPVHPVEPVVVVQPLKVKPVKVHPVEVQPVKVQPVQPVQVQPVQPVQVQPVQPVQVQPVQPVQVQPVQVQPVQVVQPVQPVQVQPVQPVQVQPVEQVISVEAAQPTPSPQLNRTIIQTNITTTTNRTEPVQFVPPQQANAAQANITTIVQPAQPAQPIPPAKPVVNK